MPADTKASGYRWYMTAEGPQVICYEWRPKGEFISSMTTGFMFFLSRESTEISWEEAGTRVQVSNDIAWVIAKSLAQSEGFNVEESLA